MDQALFQNLVSALVLALVGVITFFLKGVAGVAIEYLKAKLGVENTRALKSFAASVVRSLEQSPAFRSFDGQGKKEYAMSAITTYAKEHGLPIDAKFIDKIIEEAVQVMNVDLNITNWLDDEPLQDDEVRRMAGEFVADFAKGKGYELPAKVVEDIVDNVMNMVLSGAKEI